MRISLRFLLPGIIIGLLIIVGTVLVSGFIYSNYQREMKNIVNERITDLKVIQSTLYDPILYYRAYTMYPELGPLFVKRTAQAPNVVFLRVVHPTGKILISNLEEEVGETMGNLPPFLPEASVYQREWKGEPILEISMRGVATENLWMGVSLKPIQQAVFRLAILMGLGIFGAVIFIGLILYFLLRRILLNPIMALYAGMEKVKKGNLDVKIDVKSKTEIGELADTFNEMLKDLRKSHTALGESKTVLEIKVKARTSELEELNKSLDEKVEERTKELQGKLGELERFQRIAIGRELKMVELKKEIKRLEEESKKTKGRAPHN